MVSLSMEGVSDAVETIKELIIPWRRKNAERLAKLANALRQAEIQKLNGEAMALQAKAEREKASVELDKMQIGLLLSQSRKTEAEAQLILAQAEKIHVEVERERSDLRKAQIELAFSIIDRYSPDLGNSEKVEYAIRLLPIIERLTSE